MKKLLAILVAVWMLCACQRIFVSRIEPDKRARAENARTDSGRALDPRALPDLATSAPLAAVLEYAFNASGVIEAAYFDWRAAIERTPQAGALPDPTVEFKAAFAARNLKSFKLGAPGPGTGQDIPGSGRRAAQAALGEAQAKGERFRAAKFALQRLVVETYAQLALNEALTRLTSDSISLLKETSIVTQYRFHGRDSASLAERRKIESDIQTAESEQRRLFAAQPGLAAEVNGWLNRPPNAPLPSARLPEIALPTSSPADLFARAIERNAELAAMRKDVEARGAAEMLAALARRPEHAETANLEYETLNPQSLRSAINEGMALPANRARIRAAIAGALASRQAAEARYRAAEAGGLSRLVTALVAARDAERIIEEYRGRIMPRAREFRDIQLQAYAQGGGDLLSSLDVDRTLIELKKIPMQAECDRLRFLAQIEEILGEDIWSTNP